ncbi:MAG TPA: GH116 family glycosyl hydrolase [Bacteroidota bacterium]|nr:GH116 family glycosyl hydrolase [Bacteroidota bacterium]
MQSPARALSLALLLQILAHPTLTASVSSSTGTSVGYCTIGGRLSAEDSAAVSWLSGVKGFSFRILDIARARLDRPAVDIVWIHVPDSASWVRWGPYADKLRQLGAFYAGGGRFLCTDFGAMVPFIAGIESEKPEFRPLAITDDWLFDQKGLQGFRGHPVYDGFFGGVFTWDTNADNIACRVGYFGDRYPREGKVVGIEKSYVVLESDNKLMMEYSSGKGRGIAIGAFINFSGENAKAPHLRKFIENTLRYVGSKGTPRGATYWLRAENRPRKFNVSTPSLPPSRRMPGTLPESGLLITRDDPHNEFYDVAGLRALVMGRENGGIDELWVHPFRVVRDFRAGLVTGDSIRWLASVPLSIEVRPESFTRLYRTDAGTLREVIFPSYRRGGALVHYEWAGDAPGAPLIVSFRSDLRWMWPYDERALGDVYYGYDETLHALHVKDLSGDFSCLVGGDIPPKSSLSGQFSGIRLDSGRLTGDTTGANQVFSASVYDFSSAPGRGLNIAIVGTDGGGERALADYRALLRDPASEYGALVSHYRTLLARSVTVETPDREFNTLWNWTLVGVDRFAAETPRLGTALLAGFSTVDRGWDGAHKISGRPGYAWYFGRDAVWSGFAIDDYGDFATVRREIEFLQKYQDMTGKIFHEVSTSGVVHYDASDATPLYVLLAAHYLRASGDREFIRASWPHLKKAMDFLYSTDTDGDLLIENTNVGHGWVEGGKLWPVHSEFYLAGIWGEALQDASWMASLVGEKDLARKYSRDALVVKRKVDTEFWNPVTKFYNYGKLKDGSYNPEPTVLPAPVMFFGWLADAKVLPILKRYEGDGFSTDWGTRIVSEESSLFSPGGYHYGAVWPLFTGWTALAEYEYGNSTQAFTHMTENMEIENHWAAGFVQEVLNGSVYRPAGVCPHQCWSETNFLHPGIHGMIGWSPRATQSGAALVPRFPINWSHADVRNLRVGGSTLDMSFEHAEHSLRYRLTLTKGRPVKVDFTPEIPEGMEIIVVSVNGKGVNVPVSLRRGVLADPLRLVVRDSVEIRLTYSGGVGVIPLTPGPAPGDSSKGFRFLGASLHGLDYTIDLEGRSGSREELGMIAFDQKVVSVTGGTVIREGPSGELVLGIPFDSADTRWVTKQVVVHLQEVQR